VHIAMTGSDGMKLSKDPLSKSQYLTSGKQESSGERSRVGISRSKGLKKLSEVDHECQQGLHIAELVAQHNKHGPIRGR